VLPAGAVELPLEGAVEDEAEELGVELPEALLCFEPELSQPTSASAESSAAAASHFLSITVSSFGPGQFAHSADNRTP